MKKITFIGAGRYFARVEVWRYGIDINVGDTRGPAGVFRALRTLPVMLDIASDIERLCPQAFVLNYTNPMAPVGIPAITKCSSSTATSAIQASSPIFL